MIIGIDLDGVVFDSEQTFRTYEEIYDIDILNSNNLIDREEPKFQSRYNWTKEEEQDFKNRYFLEVSAESNLMSGFKIVYKLLRELGCKFVVISARGGIVKEMKDDALRILKENDIEFDKYYFAEDYKVQRCIDEKVDIMIDDDYKVVERLADNKIKTLYFRDIGLKKLEENEYIKEVNNWGDIYRIIKSVKSK